MPESLAVILERLDAIAAYDGPWTLMQHEAALLGQRLKELRERETRLDDLLVVALVGGSGVGKSTLLNALAGDELAKTSEFRPCTSLPTVYHPPGARLAFSAEWTSVAGSALENLVIIDTPDSDTIVRHHREIVIGVLAQCDLILVCADSEKYLDEATWSLLRPLRAERTLVCVETKAAEAASVRDHWLQRMLEQGVKTSGYFRVNSRRTFDRKLAGRPAGDDEYDFPALENFLYRELTRERIQRIKRSNVAGLLSKTLSTLEQRVCAREQQLRALEKALNAADAEIARDSFEIVSSRLFAESHLWTYALGREMSLRSKGFVGTLFRLVETVRTIPARMASWSFWPARGAGKQAASLLTQRELLNDNLEVTSDDLRMRYSSQRTALGLLFAQAGFAAPKDDDGFQSFNEELNRRIAEVLRGPARDRVVAKARILTSWPVAVGTDIPPVAFLGISSYNIVGTYLEAEFLDAGFFLHAGAVLAILLAVEMTGLSGIVHYFAWNTRRAAMSDLRISLIGNRMGFRAERDALNDALTLVSSLQDLKRSVLGDSSKPSAAPEGGA